MEYAFLAGMYPHIDQEINDTPLSQGVAYAIAGFMTIVAIAALVSVGVSL